MKRKYSRVSKEAVKLEKRLTKKAEKCGRLRSDVFIEIDEGFGYHAGSTARHIDKLESTFRGNRKLNKKPTWDEKKEKREKPKWRATWGKVHSENELKNYWWNIEEKKGGS